MNKKIISFTAALALSITALTALHAYADEAAASNSINISESFNSADPTGTIAYTGSSKDYTWNIFATRDFGYNSSAYIEIPSDNKLAVSLTKNNANNGTENTILTIPKGAGGMDKDIDITLDAGVCKSFAQAAKIWDLTFTASDGTKMFSLRFMNGNDNTIAAALVVGDKVQNTNAKFTEGKFTNVKATISFNENGGGYVTFENVSADFEGGSDVAKIFVSSSSATDYNRPFVIDNFTMKTVDKTKIYFDVTSTGEGQSVKGAELGVDNHTYKLGEDGQLLKYLRPDTTYPYTVKLPNHEQISDNVRVYTADKYVDTYTFKDVDARRPMLIHAYYDEKSGALSSLTADNVPVSNKTLTVNGEKRHGFTEKYFLWNSLKGMKPYAAAEVKAGEPDTIHIPLEYHETVSPAKIELTGGDEYLYIPNEGYLSSAPISAEVYDNLGFIMKNAAIEWSLPKETAATIGVVNGAVTIGSEYNFSEKSHTVKIRATVQGTSVYAEKDLIIRKISDVESFNVTGPAVIKNGTTAQYTVTDVKNGFGEDMEIPAGFTLTASYKDGGTSLAESELNANGLTITPDINLGGAREKKIKITIALDGTDKKLEKEATVYDYDFYEPGIGTASYGNPRMEEVSGAVSIVWPATQSGGKTTSIPLPKPVELTPGSCKVITFDNFATGNYVGYQERSLHIVNSDGVDIINIDFSSIRPKEETKDTGTVITNWVSGSSGNRYSGDEIGKYTINTKSSAEFTLRTDAQGITSVNFKYNGNDIADEQVAGMVYDIAEIRMRGGSRAPDERMLSLTNIKIDNGVLNGVEITGGDKIAIVSGADAKKQFGVKLFSHEDGETFKWSVTDKSNKPIEGVAIDNDGVLTVSDSVKSLIDASTQTENGSKYITALVKYTGTKGTETKKEIKIMDYAGVSSFSLTGPEYLAAGTETATYSISDIIDTYGNEADMQKAYMITTGEDIASVNIATGEVTLDPSKTGTFTVTAAVGNPDNTKMIDLPVTVAKYSDTGDVTDGNAEVDVTKLANYAADTKYLVTTATNDGKLVNQTEQTASAGGIVTVDTTDADKYEVSPIYSYTDVGDVSAGKEIPICDGTYDFTFKKSETQRADIYVNGAMVGQNVDQISVQRTLSEGSEYTARDVKVEGGKAVVAMKDNFKLDYITVRKAPSIVKRKTHVYVLGDSLASAYYGAYDTVDENGIPLPGTGQTGWGETLGYFLDDDMIVTNLAESGSAAAALYATTFSGIIQNAEAGDYLIMECGYQDGPNSTKDMMLSAVNNIYHECKEKGVELILVTPNCAAHGTANIEAISRDGGVRFGPALMEYAKDTENAKTEEILGIDLSGAYTPNNEYSMLIDFGEEYWLNNFNLIRPEDGVAVDKLHSSYWGAVLHAATIATAIDEAQRSEENTELAARLANLKLDTDKVLVMTDSNGDQKKFRVGWYTNAEPDVPIQEENVNDQP